jgi:hypothetical protein
MVNYHDPATIAGEYGACPFLPVLQRLQVARLISIRLFYSGARQVLARREWHIYVGLSLYCPALSPSRRYLTTQS